MSTVIVAITKSGARLAAQLAAEMPHAHVYVKYADDDGGQQARSFTNLGELTTKIFSSYRQLIFIMAVGIVARVTAPHIRDKRTDPAVVVIDDGGKHAISFLSGHIGGANELTMQVASIIGAAPVITTATDVAGKPAPDVLSVKINAKIVPFVNLKKINAAIVNGGEVKYFLDNSLPQVQRYRQAAAALGITCWDLEGFEDNCCDAAILITDKLYPVTMPHIFLRPPALAIGIGCRRGTDKAKIRQAIDDACNQVNRCQDSIAIVASTIIKNDEVGLLAASEDLGARLQFFTNEELQQCIGIYNLQISKFVNDMIGVGNVCEASAILAAKAKSAILPKTKMGPVTVSIALIQ